ncbi:hypothetical protein DVR09_15255 (plasmid) [Erythrobacter aureus]|uniref:Uncharacterized protein n=2 Tax=Erythrobacter aureus TaxID=2182384 RepID=A0A345YIQ9_9SPHN|nr:hypothetical protein DVR09_15255 [Erythrobacter aureus]
MNLMHDTAATFDAAANWAAITAIAADGIVYISEETVAEAAKLLENAPLSNGQTVTAYHYPVEDEFAMPSFVPSFGPSLLGEDTFRQLRTLLEEESDAAVAMFDTIVELGLQISLSGKDYLGSRLKGVNGVADEVEINRSSGNLYEMFRQLGVDYDGPAGYGEIELAKFEAAVEENGWRTDMPDRLEQFIACAKRHGASTVSWG